MRPIRAPASLGVLLAALGAAAGCGDHGSEARRPELPAPTFRLLVVTDVKGYLAPCGCQSRPLGGVDKLATALARARADHVPTLFVAAGDLLFDGAGHAGVEGPDAATQEVWKAETLVQILGRLGLAAAAPGRADFANGADMFVRLARSARFAVLGASVSVAEPASAYTPPPALVKDVGGTRVGVIGVADLAGPSGALPDGVTATGTAVARATAAAARARHDGAEVVVALVTGSRRTAREIARAVPSIDFVVEGGLDDADVGPPTVVSNAVMLHAARQGHGLLVVDVYRRPARSAADSSAWQDVGDWSVRTERARLDGRIADLRARIAAWERNKATNPTELAQQRARLTELERDKAALRPGELRSNGFAARWDELGPEVRADRSVTAMLAAYDSRVNEHNRRVFADVVAPDPAPGQARYVGSDSCAQGQCHGEAYAQWRATPHGRAYETLVTVHKQFNLSCVSCHVTGYGQPGGSTVVHVENLIDVGCENCHGPGSLHVANPTAVPSTLARDAPESVCARCHTPEHSDLFSYASYRARVLGPGHGMPMADGRLVVGQRPGATQ